MNTKEPAKHSAWTPLRHSVFAVLWGATLISNVGSWMHDMCAGWLMTMLSPSPSPVMVALVQAATTLPVFLFSLPAGALADRIDRRRMLIVIQIAMAIVAALIGAFVLTGAMTAQWLLLFTFALGTGTAASLPVWQAIVPRLVPKEDLPTAMALNAVSINLSRAIGPTIGGILIASLGIAWPFLINAMSFIAIIAALLWWRTPSKTLTTSSPREPSTSIVGDMLAGIKHVAGNLPLRATLVRSTSYFVFASAYWALLPLIARDQLKGGSELYGVLVGCIGAGAVTGAQFLPRLRARFGADRVVMASSVGTILAMLVFALTHNGTLGVVASFVAGTTWLSAVATTVVSAQLSLPDFVRARGLSIYNTLFYGALAFGSIGWGHLAERSSISACLIIAAIGLSLSMLLTRRFDLKG
jgi:MFS family permease